MSQIKFNGFKEHKVTGEDSLDKIAKQNQLTWQKLSEFNWSTSTPAEINDCLQEFVGCWKKTSDGKNYMFSDEDKPGIVYIPAPSPEFQVAAGETHIIEVRRPHYYCTIEVETVDDFFQPVGGVTLVLERQEGGPAAELTTDGEGYGKKEGLLPGHYKVQVKGQGPAYFITKTDDAGGDSAGDDIGQVAEAVIDTREFLETITHLVVQRNAQPVDKRERRLLKQAYTRKKELKPLQGRGTETNTKVDRSEYHRRLQRVSIDNLALAAGWTDRSFKEVNVEYLVGTVLPGYFQDKHKQIYNRGFFAIVIQPDVQLPSVTIYSQSGQKEAWFKYDGSWTAPYGVYSLFEKEYGRQFVDVTTQSESLRRPGSGKLLGVDYLVMPGDRSTFISIYNSHHEQIPVILMLPNGPELITLGRHGGTGRLEDYGMKGDSNEVTHARNMAVCSSIADAYSAYIDIYVEKVKKAPNEIALWKLGPPDPPYYMPAPANSTREQVEQLMELYAPEDIRPWKYIAQRLDALANEGEGRLTQGLPFIRLKAKYEAKTPPEILAAGMLKSTPELLPTSYEFEGSFTMQLTDADVRSMVEMAEPLRKWSSDDLLDIVKGMKGGDKESFGDEKFWLGLEYKTGLVNQDSWEVTLRTGPLEVETNSEQNIKVSVEALPEIWAVAEGNPRNAQMMGGVKVETGAIIGVLGKIPWLERRMGGWLEKYGEFIIPKEIQIQVGFAGVQQETLLAITSNAPGFFERRPLDELLDAETKWNDLTFDEKVHLTHLEWTQASWDFKQHSETPIPESATKEAKEFEAGEMIAVVHLGFNDIAEYQNRIRQIHTGPSGWKDALQRMAAERYGKKSNAASAK